MEETKRGPSLSLCTLRGPRLTSESGADSTKTERAGKQEARGTRKGRKRKRVHTLIHALPSSPPVLPKTKWGEDEERGRGRTRRGKEEKRRRKRWKNNSSFIVGQLANEGGCWCRGERLSREPFHQCKLLCVTEYTQNCVCWWVFFWELWFWGVLLMKSARRKCLWVTQVMYRHHWKEEYRAAACDSERLIYVKKPLLSTKRDFTVSFYWCIMKVTQSCVSNTHIYSDCGKASE